MTKPINDRLMNKKVLENYIEAVIELKADASCMDIPAERRRPSRLIVEHLADLDLKRTR